MGCASSWEKAPRIQVPKEKKNYKLITNHFTTYEDLQRGLREVGLESCQLIVGIDFTKSNTWQGGLPYYDNENLHAIGTAPNPYQRVLEIIGKTLEPFDDDHKIPAYGFGDAATKDKLVFPFKRDPNNPAIEIPCYRLDDVLRQYNQISNSIDQPGGIALSGPTTFAPLINQAIYIVSQTSEYHILLIICDGGVDNIDETVSAIVRASNYPLSIICIGLGKGPWDRMKQFDDELPERKFDNFQFVNFHEMMQKCENEEIEFAKNALMEIPDQYEYIKRHLLH